MSVSTSCFRLLASLLLQVLLLSTSCSPDLAPFTSAELDASSKAATAVLEAIQLAQVSPAQMSPPSLPPLPHPLPAPDPITFRYYRVTGHTLSLAFKRFFDANGGLDLFGYPLSEMITQDSLTVQYFQRARFELHPETARAGRDVQLSLLGILSTAGRVFPPVAPFAPGPSRLYFPQTHHSVSSPFLEFYQSHRGTTVFGYPISEEFVERGLLTQYFQHTRLEYHPEAKAPYKVQVGLLGQEYLNALSSPAVKSAQARLSLAQAYGVFGRQEMIQLTLEQKIGQMLLVPFDGASFSPTLLATIQHRQVGGLIFFGANIASAQQMRALTQKIQTTAAIPLFLSTDQEGGVVNRLLPIVGPRPTARSIGDSGDTRAAAARGRQDSSDLRNLGLNLDFSPDLDVLTNPASTAIGSRSFGSDPTLVSRMGTAYISGLQSQGVIATGKHFPGIGGVSGDPHLILPVSQRSLPEMRRIDLPPFSAAISTHVGMIMVTNVLVPALDPKNQANLSPMIVTGLLRQTYQFQGVVITDDLLMGTVGSNYTPAEAAVQAIQAGIDSVLGTYSPEQQQSVLDGLKAALQSGRIAPGRVNDAVERILRLKFEYQIISSEQE